MYAQIPTGSCFCLIFQHIYIFVIAIGVMNSSSTLKVEKEYGTSSLCKDMEQRTH